MKTTKTAVQKMFDAFVDGHWQTMNYTWEKSSHTWSDFWLLLIMSGFCFDKDDLVVIKRKCSCTRYSPSWSGVDEGCYSLAIRAGNLSFAYAYEKLVGRIPFIGINLDYSYCFPSFSNHATQSKSAGRLVIGTQFNWQGETASVTSFKDEEHSLIACAYHPNPEGYRPSKIKKRFTITISKFKQMSSDLKKAAKLLSEAIAQATAKP